MAYLPEVRGTVDAANSSVAPLLASATFTGAFVDITLYDGISVIIEGTSASVAPGTLQMQFSQNGTTVDRDILIAVDDVAGTPPRTLGTVAQYFRVVYVNGAVDQITFDIQTMYHPGFVRLVSRLDQTIATNEDVTNTRAAIVAQNDAGTWANIKSDNLQHLKVNASNPKTAFDELSVAELSPIEQLTYPYLVNTDTNIITTTNSGTVTQANNMALVGTGTSANSQAILQSKRFLPFRAGQGVMARFAAVFTLGVADAASRQWVGVGDADNGFLFGYDTTNFSVTFRTDGTPTVINQTAWNVDVMDGTGSASNPSGMLLDPTKGNLYQVSYGSGFGAVNFSIESDLTGDMVLVHVLEYGNSFVVPSTYNPSHPMCAEAHNGTIGTDDIVLSVAAMSGFIEGENLPTGPQNGIDDSIGATTTELPILTLQGRSTFGGQVNKVDALLRFVSVNNDVNQPATFRIRRGATFSAAPTFVDVSTLTSVIETTVGGANGTMTPGTGTIVWVGQVGKDQGDNSSLEGLDIRVRPGETMTITVEMFSGSGATAAAIMWIEDF
jgi:hypothetical protein